ncbi:MAG TPA: tetratricopeptide repeat protein [Chloroflexia bacterium]|nr:tetratricopeptide repeat protein [Chloroflexia bacterium]
MSYTAKRLIILLMAWGLLVFVGVTVRINLNMPPPPAVEAPTPTTTPAAATAADRANTLQQALAQNPDDLPSLLELAGIFYQARQWPDAITLYQRAISLDPHNVDVLAHLAAAQLYALRMDDARQTLEQAAQLAPDRPDLHLLLGLAASRQDPPDQAFANAEWLKVLALAPGTALAQQAQDLLAGRPVPTPSQ